jgi:internalin A
MIQTPEPILTKIREAKDKQLTELDLSSGQITQIPVEVFELAPVEVLNLNNNRLATIPEAITRLHNLTLLDLSDNQLTTVPVRLATCIT